MSAQETVQKYLKALKNKQDWSQFLADDMVFINNGKEIRGKENYIESTKRFFSSIQSLEVRNILVDGDLACALNHYTLSSPSGNTIISDVAEIYSVHEGKFTSFAIYFDTAPFAPK